MDRKELLRRIGELEKSLGRRKVRFADKYIGTGDAIKAAAELCRNIGDAEKLAFSMLKREDMCEYIELRERLLSRDIGVTKGRLAADLVEIKERCMAAKPVMVRDPETKAMVESGEWTFDVSGALKAIEKLGDMLRDGGDEDEKAPCAAASMEERERILRSIAEEFKEGDSGN